VSDGDPTMSIFRNRSWMPRRRGKTLEGILVPWRWKTSGEVAAMVLNTLDEREYLIEDPTCMSRGLERHLQKRVRLIGTVIENRVVRIAAIAVVDTPGMPESPLEEGDEE
jgi:hypothetical protein